ncbi:hypothetical protein B0H19DRAFT_1292894 [Mycena capillaripes]|nr:hypothetical protein B0H19DRAFT_1292894 [Mycena capillaripes]
MSLPSSMLPPATCMAIVLSSALNCRTIFPSSTRRYFPSLNKIEDLIKAIVYSCGGLTSALPVLEVQLTAHEHVAKSSYLRFELLSQGHNIADAVETTQRALALTRLRDKYCLWVLEKYIFYLEGHYRHFSQAKDLDEAEVHCRKFMCLCPVGNFHHALASQALGCHLLTRFQSHKDTTLLEESISLCQTALSLQPPRDVNRHAPIKALAIATRLRFELRKEDVDIKRSICTSRRPSSFVDQDLFLMTLVDLFTLLGCCIFCASNIWAA